MALARLGVFATDFRLALGVQLCAGTDFNARSYNARWKFKQAGQRESSKVYGFVDYSRMATEQAAAC
jgi:hypothetical protein